MIQRIQTLWLLLAACCMGLCMALPVAKYHVENMPVEGHRVDARLDLFARGGDDMANLMDATAVNFGQDQTSMATWPLVSVAALCIVVAVVSISLFKRRSTQMRLTAAGFILSVVYVFLVFFWAVDHYSALVEGFFHVEPVVEWTVGSFAPLASVLFFFLAQRAIRRDEALVRSADRLR
ncbi:MAG: DUF4293 domain-containing protein [Bacteroidales bacterium]|nr:DUF4293 domain-containing protein [Bacteroidales bacterium]